MSLKRTNILNAHISIYKLFAWSLLIEPLLFFIIFENNFGLGGNISRIFQLIILLYLGLKFAIQKVELKIPNPFFHPFRYYFIYFLYASTVTFLFPFISISSGEYVSRPLGELLITFYYFLYFVILPIFIFRSRESLDYLFKIFKFTFLACLILGFLELVIFFFTGVETIPRHIVDLRGSGMRFNGLAGEPRDAFSYLLFGISMYVIYFMHSQRSVSLRFLFFVIICAVLTVSTSGLLGVIFSLILISLFIILPKLLSISISRLALIFISSIIFAIFLSYLIFNNERLNVYYEAIILLFSALENGYELPEAIMGQMPNIYPFWHRFQEIDTVQGILNLFFGSGLGSASAINNILSTGNTELLNPHAGITRAIYETGLLGTFLFILAFISPIKNLKIPSKEKRWLTYSILILLGCYFGHRSAVLFIFFGITLSVINVKYGSLKNIQKNQQTLLQ